MIRNFSLIGFDERVNGVDLVLFNKREAVLCLMNITQASDNHRAVADYELYSGDKAIEAFQLRKHNLTKITNYQPSINVFDYEESEINQGNIRRIISSEKGDDYDFGSILTLREGKPYMLISECDLYNGPIEEEKAYIAGYDILPLDRWLKVYILCENSGLVIFNYEMDIPDMSCIKYRDVDHYPLTEKSSWSIIMNPKYTDMKNLEITLPNVTDFTPLYPIELVGLNLKNMTIDGDIWVVNKDSKCKGYLEPHVIEVKTESVKQEGNILETKSIDEIEAYKREIRELKEDMKCLMRIIKRYGVEL